MRESTGKENAKKDGPRVENEKRSDTEKENAGSDGAEERARRCFCLVRQVLKHFMSIEKYLKTKVYSENSR